ncbi:hypothetical protein FGO68_gene3422 [Halteria grandinella]|uniref:Protein kinase domain-containing protein n=1 Tax=Halteria grandinella TaxID=5974 RepID=A0A8J8T4W9_HALGN|nr:hypothetical protein FGO68_gene3422 [Halteria grandinella]
MVAPPSQVVNGFRKIKKLSEGATGESHLVEEMSTSTKYTMKIVSQTYIAPNQKKLTEYEFLKTSDHPFIIRYFKNFPLPSDFSERHCIILEHTNSTLRSYIGKPVTEKVALNWAAHVSLGLAEIHSRGLVHCDLRPETILITAEEAGGIAKVGDFGGNGVVMITNPEVYRYYAPERHNQAVQQESSDVWALGIVLHELLSGGRFPFNYDFQNGSLADYMTKIPNLPINQISQGLSGNFHSLLEKMLEKDPAKRPTINDLLQSTIISERIQLITEEQILGSEKCQRIKKQLLELKIKLFSNNQLGQISELYLKPYTPLQDQYPQAPQDIVPQQIPQLQVLIIEQQPVQMPIQQPELPASHLFTQEKLDLLIKTFNSPMNNITPLLNDKGQSKMTETVLKFGWKLSLAELNNHADMNKAIELNIFEGGYSRHFGIKLQQGVYYGQMADGKRHGIGMVYCTSTDNLYGNNQWLYECQWDKGAPCNKGRYIRTRDSWWSKWEGIIDQMYRLAEGTGSYQDNDGDLYVGEWKQGNFHGQGKYCYPGGSIYEGQWAEGAKSGQGRLTEPDGSYHEGEWKEDYEIGWHIYYTADGVYSKKVKKYGCIIF